MNDCWYTLENSVTDDRGSIQTYARVNKESPWFSGHFPGEPILPGIAQISLVCEAIKKSRVVSNTTLVKEIHKLRFRRVIRPDETILIQIKPDVHRRGSHRFKITVNNELACNGIIVLE